MVYFLFCCYSKRSKQYELLLETLYSRGSSPTGFQEGHRSQSRKAPKNDSNNFDIGKVKFSNFDHAGEEALHNRRL
jgi:hypothetical protein